MILGEDLHELEHLTPRLAHCRPVDWPDSKHNPEVEVTNTTVQKRKTTAANLTYSKAQLLRVSRRTPNLELLSATLHHTAGAKVPRVLYRLTQNLV